MLEICGADHQEGQAETLRQGLKLLCIRRISSSSGKPVLLLKPILDQAHPDYIKQSS